MVDKNNKLKKVFAESLSIAIEKVVDELEYNTISEWDSIGHMSLIAAIEDEFDIMMETDDIIDMSTFKKAKEMLNKYN
jgi:acyl carrier protein